LRRHTEPNSMNGMELVTSESGLAAARDRVLRMGTESDSMEGTERGSCWQMCKVLFGRACSRFFTRWPWSWCLPCHKMGFCWDVLWGKDEDIMC
jgi:hypothetical protein